MRASGSAPTEGLRADVAGRPGAGRLDDGEVLRDWLARAVPALEEARERIDAVNVFPVPDGDTGTNVLLTVRGAAEEVGRAPGAGGPDVLRALARGALLSARGNSGVILSRYLGGLTAAASGPLPEALRQAADAARAAVPVPEDGTVLTVAAGVADAARDAARAGAGDADALAAGVAAGRDGLARVSAAHPVLRSARVVDAGACALLVLLDALAAALAGGAGTVDVGWLAEHAGPGGRTPAPHAGQQAHPGTETPPGADPVAYEVVALLVTDAADALADAVTDALGAVGDAVAVVPGDGLVTAHVHATAPAEVAAVLAGSGASWTATVRALLGRPRPVVACTASAGGAAALADAGAVAVLAPAGTDPAATRDAVRRAARDAAADGARVTVLPGAVLPPGDADPGWDVPAGATDDEAVLAAVRGAGPAGVGR